MMMMMMMMMMMYRDADNAEPSDAVWSDITAAMQASHPIIPTLCQCQTRPMVAGCLLG